MSAKTDTIVRNLLESIKNVGTEKTSAFDSVATVRRIEGNTAWVHFEGGAEETPAKLTINAKIGDQVQVRVSNGVAFLVGNGTAPPTDDTAALMAQNAANQAIDSANIAFRAASSAVEDAAIANEAATQAQNAADQAIEDAATASSAASAAQTSANQAIQNAATAQASASAAQTAASNAQTSANTANTAANNALTQLSVVEDVVGTLNWISQHGTYTASTDTEVVPGKYYFTRTGSGTEADPYVYTVVVTPTGNPSTNNYYELDSIDEAVSNYVATHLALTNEGLYVSSDINGWRVRIDSDSVDIIDPDGNVVSSFGGVVKVGDGRNGQILISIDGIEMTESHAFPVFKIQKLGTSTTLTLNEHVEQSPHKIKYECDPNYNISTYVIYNNGGPLDGMDIHTFSIGTSETYTNPDLGEMRYDASEQTFTFTPVVPAVYERVVFDKVVYRTTVEDAAYTLGTRTGESGVNSIVIGIMCEASGTLSYAGGYQSTARGFGAHSEGHVTKASGNYSHAEGYYSEAKANVSHAEGSQTLASEYCSHAEGFYSRATGDASHAEGNRTLASGDYSHAEGHYSEATGNVSHAEGCDTKAGGLYSHAQNLGTVANGEGQTVVGKYNVVDNSNKYAFIVGNGTGDGNRSNALAIDWEGNIEAAGGGVSAITNAEIDTICV